MDYRSLTLAQLREAHENIDRARYPRNFVHLVEELRSRPPDPPPGSVLPELLVVSTRGGMRADVFGAIVFTAMGVAGAIALTVWPEIVLRKYHQPESWHVPPIASLWLFEAVLVGALIQSWRNVRNDVAVSLAIDTQRSPSVCGSCSAPAIPNGEHQCAYPFS